MNANVTVYLTEDGFKMLREKAMATGLSDEKQIVSCCFVERGEYYIEVSVDIKCVDAVAGIIAYLEV